jgi:PAS domain S-box-containing protein
MASLASLDLEAVLRMTRSLSSEMVLDKLVEALMTTALEHAGADRGLLVLNGADGPRIEAQASTESGPVVVRQPGKPPTPQDLPESILRHVECTRASVALDDARVRNSFSRDEYLRSTPPHSLLCVPLVRQAELVGALYLENTRTSHVFTPARRAIIELLSAQAAISLRNAELYASLARENAERRQSEASLRRSEERYALAIEAATDGHGEFCAEDGLFYSSPRMLEQWGLPPELAVIPRVRMMELFPFHPEDRERVVALLDRHRDSDTRRLDLESRVVRRGEFRWMHCTVLYVRDAEGKLLRSSVVTSDVTERKQAEEEMRLSEQRYVLALAGSNEGVFDWDLRTNLIYAPPRTQELLELPVGNCWRTREEWESQIEYHPGDYERMQAALEEHFAGLTPMYEMEVRIVLASGNIRSFLHRGTVLRDAAGTPYRMVGSLGDITERKVQQAEMLRLESRLRQAERFEAMGTLAEGIAHDFNNILGAILGYGERALRAVDEGGRLHHDLHNVMVAGEHGRTLVERILSFSRGTAGARMPVDVQRVVRETLDMLQARLPAHVKLHTHLQAGRAAILGGAVQVHQLVMNLGMNAAQAMAQAGTLTVSLELEEVHSERQARVGAVAAGQWVVLRVADQGSGVAPEILERIFDPFFTTRQGVGTGLGLSLVQRIVTQAGGAIDVASTPGVGSLFTIHLPRSGDAPVEPPNLEAELPRGRGQRVMVVDDEEPLLDLTTRTLRELGYDPMGYRSGQAAAEAFRADPESFDILVTDLRMPGLSGDDLIREARRLRPLLPVILVSGYVGDAASASGWADEVLTKPLRTNVLATSLARVLRTA